MAELIDTQKVCEEIKVMKQLSLLFLCVFQITYFQLKEALIQLFPDRKLKIVLNNRKF